MLCSFSFFNKWIWFELMQWWDRSLGSHEVRQAEVESTGQFLRWTESQPDCLQHELLSLRGQRTSAQHLNGQRGKNSLHWYVLVNCHQSAYKAHDKYLYYYLNFYSYGIIIQFYLNVTFIMKSNHHYQMCKKNIYSIIMCFHLKTGGGGSLIRNRNFLCHEKKLNK